MPLLTRYRELPQANAAHSSLAMVDGVTWIATSSARPRREASEESMVHQGCSNPDCANSWRLPWRSRKRPMLEGRWGCSSRCIADLVRKVVVREAGAGLAAPREPHRHRIPLGLVMLAQGWISQSQLRHALEAQRAAGTGRIGDWLVRECGVGREQVLRALGVQWSCPVLRARSSVSRQMGYVLPKQLSGEFRMIPWRVLGSGTLQLAFADTLDASAALAVEKMTGLKVQSGLIDEKLFTEAHQKLLSSEGIAASFERLSGMDALAERIASILEKQQPLASRLMRIHDCYWLRIWLESGALDTLGCLPNSSEDLWDYVFRCNPDA